MGIWWAAEIGKAQRKTNKLHASRGRHQNATMIIVIILSNVTASFHQTVVRCLCIFWDWRGYSERGTIMWVRFYWCCSSQICHGNNQIYTQLNHKAANNQFIFAFSPDSYLLQWFSFVMGLWALPACCWGQLGSWLSTISIFSVSEIHPTWG